MRSGRSDLIGDSSPPRSKPLIWIVDDSRTQAAITEQALGTQYQFERFVDGQSAIERLANDAAMLPDLVLLDWVMPGLSGDEVCRYLRAMPRTQDLPIVIVTSSRNESSDVVCAIESGANDYVSKPFVAEELRARVFAIVRANQVRLAAAHERRRLTAINQLGRALFHAGTDVERILLVMADVLVANLCDGCAITPLPGPIPQIPTYRHRSERGALLLAPLAGITDLALHTFASSENALSQLPAPAGDYIREYGLRGLAVMAIPGRAHVHCIVSLTRDGRSESFDEDDLAALQTCFDHTGLTIDAAILSEAERATTRFHEEMLGIVGHDLRTPLGAMTVGIDLLRQTTNVDPAARERTLGRLDRSARRMTEIVDQLLDVTRVRLGAGIQVTPRSTHLLPIVTGVLDELRLVHPRTKFEVSGADVEGLWDPDRLAQVLSNLASNAVQYGRRGAPVLIDLSRGDDIAYISVRNENQETPIPVELLRTLFDPFKRGNSRNRDESGLGLGLYIVNEIVRAHGGTIDATSLPEGTTFRVALRLDSNGHHDS